MKQLFTIWLILSASVTFAQTSKSISAYVVGQYNKPVLDWNMKNNPAGVGLGLETFFLTDKKIQPTVDLAQNVFLRRAEFSQSFGSTDKAADIRGNTSLLAGISVHPIRYFYFSFAVGTTLVNQKSYFSTKPSIGFYFDKGRNWTTKLSVLGIHKYVPIKPVFDGTPDKESTGYFQVSFGHKLF